MGVRAAPQREMVAVGQVHPALRWRDPLRRPTRHHGRRAADRRRFGGAVKAPPNTPEAERSVLGQIMAGGPKVAGNVIGTLLEPGDFYSSAHRALFERI